MIGVPKVMYSLEYKYIYINFLMGLKGRKLFKLNRIQNDMCPGSAVRVLISSQTI